MKKTLAVLFSLAVFQGIAAKTVKVINITLDKKHIYQAMTWEEASEVDSIAVTGGKLDAQDFQFLARCCNEGKLSGIDLSGATTHTDEIPDWLFRPSKINSARQNGSKESVLGHLQYFRLPYGIHRIGEQAFFNTGLRMIEIPKTVGIIGDNAFANCEDLREVTVRNPNGAAISARYAFDDNMSAATLIVPTGSAGSFASDEAWAKFGEITERDGLYTTRYATLNGNTLESVLGDDLQTTDSLVVTGTLKTSDFQSLRNGIYNGKLTGINLSGCYIENNAIPEHAFTDETDWELKSKLQYVTLPEGVTSIGKEAFADCYTLQAVNLPQSLTYIGEAAFYQCFRMRGNITIPEGMTRLSVSAFDQCRRLSGFYLPSSLSVLGQGCFYLRISMDEEWNVTFRVNRMTPPETAPSEGFYNNPFNSSPSKMKKMLLHSTLYVPVGAKPAYEADEMWSCFGKIIETPDLTGSTSGIAAPNVEKTAHKDARIYTLDGRYVGTDMTRLGKGVYVVNGKKVVR